MYYIHTTVRLKEKVRLSAERSMQGTGDGFRRWTSVTSSSARLEREGDQVKHGEEHYASARHVRYGPVCS